MLLAVWVERLDVRPGFAFRQTALRHVRLGAHAAYSWEVAARAVVAVLLAVIATQRLLSEGEGVENVQLPRSSVPGRGPFRVMTT